MSRPFPGCITRPFMWDKWAAEGALENSPIRFTGGRPGWAMEDPLWSNWIVRSLLTADGHLFLAGVPHWISCRPRCWFVIHLTSLMRAIRRRQGVGDSPIGIPLDSPDGACPLGWSIFVSNIYWIWFRIICSHYVNHKRRWRGAPESGCFNLNSEWPIGEEDFLLMTLLLISYRFL